MLLIYLYHDKGSPYSNHAMDAKFPTLKPNVSSQVSANISCTAVYGLSSKYRNLTAYRKESLFFENSLPLAKSP